MTDIAALTAIIEPEAQALGFDLVRVGMFGGREEPTLQVMAERPDTRQLSLGDCAELSRRLSDKLDALEAEGRDPIDHAYRLEVSSPGIDRPLTRRQDYADWAGHMARLKLSTPLGNRKQIDGDIVGLDGEDVRLDVKGETLSVPLASIAAAKLLLTDKLIAATAPLDAGDADEDEIFEEDE